MLKKVSVCIILGNICRMLFNFNFFTTLKTYKIKLLKNQKSLFFLHLLDFLQEILYIYEVQLFDFSQFI